MRLNVKALALACGLLWGGALLLVGLLATVTASAEGGHYGAAFLDVMASVYPGFAGRPRLLDALVGGAYGFVDGAIAGALLAWLYNLVASRSKSTDGS